MLLQFSVKNYMSIKDEVILSMVPSAQKEHPENIIVKDKYKALGMASIYGANASGKTSLYRALTSGLNILRNSNIRQVNDIIPIVPFRFNDNTIKEPTKFEFMFIAEDNLKYVYGFSADIKKVHEEYLYIYRTAKASMIFERKGEIYKFSRNEKKALELLVRMNTENKLFLATATSWNASVTTIPYKWLTEKIDAFTNDDNIIHYGLNKYSEEKTDNVEFTKNLLISADINISNIRVETKNVKRGQDSFIQGIVIGGQIIQEPEEQTQIQIITEHTIKEGESEKGYMLSLAEESLGTQQLFFLSPILRETLKYGKVLVMDEIDRSLHPFIVKFLVNLFRNPKANSNGAQLIFTTHETTLLSLEIFRRDQIYFTEKNNDIGITALYSLDEYPVRKDENIEKGYLLGRYGAIPFMQTEDIV